MMKNICVFLTCLFVLSIASGCNVEKKLPENNDGHLSEENNKSVYSDSVFESDGESTMPENETKAETGVNLLESMSYDEKYEVNIFLSNFSEAHYGLGHFYETEDMINFAFIHNRVNNKNFSQKAVNGKYAISQNLVNSTLERFFGKTVAAATPPGAKRWVYENGEFRIPAADGESYAYFTTATKVTERDDGMYIADFEVYFNANDPHGEVKKEWYGMDSLEAGQYFEFCYDGKAVLKPVGDTYVLVSYVTN